MLEISTRFLQRKLCLWFSARIYQQFSKGILRKPYIGEKPNFSISAWGYDLINQDPPQLDGYKALSRPKCGWFLIAAPHSDWSRLSKTHSDWSDPPFLPLALTWQSECLKVILIMFTSFFKLHTSLVNLAKC